MFPPFVQLSNTSAITNGPLYRAVIVELPSGLEVTDVAIDTTRKVFEIRVVGRNRNVA